VIRLKLLLVSFIAIILLIGCGIKEDYLIDETRLNQPLSINVYNYDISGLGDKFKKSQRLEDFPFLSNQIGGCMPSYSKEFYASRPIIKSASLADVDLWSLEQNKSLLDAISVESIDVDIAFKDSDNLFDAISKASNLSKAKQEILKKWIFDGGILWSEYGVFATRYEDSVQYYIVSEKKLKDAVEQKSSFIKFLDFTVTKKIFVAKSIDTIRYKQNILSFNTTSKITEFTNINSLKLKPKGFIYSAILIGQPVINSTLGEPLVSVVQYGKGVIISLPSFDYCDEQYDGEALRWALLEYALKLRNKSKDFL